MRAKRILVIVALAELAALSFLILRVRGQHRGDHETVELGSTTQPNSLAANRRPSAPSSASATPPGDTGTLAVPDAPVGLAAPLRDRLTIHRELYWSERDVSPVPAREHIRIVETDFQHPLIRFEERVDRDPRTGRDRVTSSKAMVADHVLVKLRDGQTAMEVVDRATREGLRVRRTIDLGRLVLLEFPLTRDDPLPATLARLHAASDWVETAEPDYLVATCETPNDPAFLDGSQWGLNNTGQSGGVIDQDMNALEAWSVRSDASGSVVAIIDTGIRLTHEDLAANLWRNAGETGGGRETNGLDDDGDGFVDDVNGINAAARSGSPADDNGHGTHVAGIVGAVGNNGRGLAGVAWRVQLMSLKFLNSRGIGVSSDGIVCLNYARQKGAHIVNASWGSSGDSVLLQQAIEACTQAGMVVVAAAGNSSVDLEVMPYYPAAYVVPGLITVASMNRMGRLSIFSNYGAAHLAAPGEAIYSAWFESDSSYRILSGTSMAAPHVAGAIALLRQQYPAETRAQRINRLLAGGTPSGQLDGLVFYGRRPNLQHSLAEASISSAPVVNTPGSRTVRIGDTLALSVDAQGAAPLTYQWRLDGNAIPGATASTLTVNNIQPAQRGEYSVVVTNSAASVYSRRIPVEIVGPPTIVTQPASQVAIAGNDASMSVVALANGAGQLSFQWFFNGAAVTGARHATLTLNTVEGAQTGAYHVVVSSSLGVSTSQEANLRIDPAQAPTILVGPVNRSVRADENTTFSVDASGTPYLSFQWKKDGVSISDATAASLAIERAQQSDAGAYSVTITNSGGSVTSGVAILDVQFAPVPPFVVRPPVGQNVFVGEQATFAVIAKGSPAPTFQWQRNGVNLPGANQSAFILSNVAAGDEGAYQVIVSNSAGAVTSQTAFLKVEGGYGLPRWAWRNPLPQGNDLLRVIPVESGVVAVGRFGTIATSPNAVAWTVRYSGTFSTLRDVVWDGGHRVVAVGDGGAIVASDDGGITWSPSFSGVKFNLIGVAFGNGRFVAVGFKTTATDGLPSVVLTSLDGATWTTQAAKTNDNSNDYLGGLLFAQGQFFAGDEKGRVANSPDGVVWSTHETGFTRAIKSFAYGNGMIVAAAWDGGLASSADGVTWSRRYQLESGVLEDVTFAQNMFVALRDDGDVLTSVDGMTWTKRATGLGGFPYPYGLSSLGANFVMIGETGTVRTSPDLATWKTYTGGAQGFLLSVAHGPTGFVAVGGVKNLHSETGVLWSEYSSASGSGLRAIIHDGSRFIAVGGKNVETSADGRKWTGRTIASASNINGLAYGGGIYAAIDAGGRIFTSTDLVTWSERLSVPGTTFSAIAYGDGKFVAVSYKSTVYTSSDAINWLGHPSGFNLELRGVAYGGGQWVAVGFGKGILHSADTVSWLDAGTRHDPFNDQFRTLNSVIYASNHFVAVGSSGVLFTSLDGVKWTEGSVGTSTLLTGVCASDRSFVAVGYGQSILQASGFSLASEALIPTPARQTVALHQSTKLEIATLGATSLSYQWVKDNVAIPGAIERILELPDPQFTDAGTYTVLIRDGTSMITSQPAYVAVVGATNEMAGLLPSGGGGGVRVEAPDGFDWMAGTTDQWLTITSAANGAGRGEVHYSVARNDSGQLRRGTLVVGDCSIAVEQPGLMIITQPRARFVAVGGSVTLGAEVDSGPTPTLQWQRNGRDMIGATSAELTLSNVQSADAGIYSAVVKNGGSTVTTQPAILGIVSDAKVIGMAGEIGSDIFVPKTGFTYDQVLLQGNAASITADHDQVTRVSYIDLTDDIVQVEFSGAGTLSLVVDNASGPATAVNYNQPGVAYVRGHGSIVITDANETTNVSVFSVGRITAINQTLFNKPIEAYDGMADLASIAILSANGKFGGVRTANTSYFATKGLTGIYAPGVEFTGPVYVGNIDASDAATPVLQLGSASDIQINGGNLRQANDQPVKVGGISRLMFVDGTTSHGRRLTAQANRARLEQDGADVTLKIVVDP